MTDRDPTIAKALDRLVPARAARGEWDAVVRDAGGLRRGRLAVAVVPIAVVLAVAALALLWPFGQQQASVLERALAAVGEGRVVHVVFRSDRGLVLVNLETGERRRLWIEREVWYEAERGLHEVWRVGDQMVEENLYQPGDVPPIWENTFAGVVDGYRASLASGRAKFLGEGEVDGAPVYWLRIDERSLAARAGTQGRDWAFDVAVAQDTFLPVATRITGNGAPTSPPMLDRIANVETLQAGEGSFERILRRPRMAEAACCKGGQRIPRDQVAGVLQAQPVWIGESFSGLPVRDADTTEGWIRWEGSEERVSVRFVRLFYGQLDVDAAPDFEEPYLLLEESLHLLPPLVGTTAYSPPPGNALISDRGVLVRRGDVFIRIIAGRTGGTERELEVARALEPMPG
jgi:hypothetical protein